MKNIKKILHLVIFTVLVSFITYQSSFAGVGGSTDNGVTGYKTKIKLDDKVSGQMMKFFKINASNDLFFKIGNGSIENKQIKSFANDYNSYLGFFRRRMGSDNTKIDKIADSVNLIKFDKLVFGKESEMLKYSIANCCNPIARDKVFGFVSVKEGVEVHKKDRPNSISLRCYYAYRSI